MAAVPICLPAVTAPCRIVVRPAIAGITAWPKLVVDPCPYSDPWKPGRRHGHVHSICDSWPGSRWIKLAPCCRKPYVLSIASAA